ncbi:MAG: chemotaxis protein CheB [Nitriliruptoraceae bacterium]
MLSDAADLIRLHIEVTPELVSVTREAGTDRTYAHEARAGGVDLTVRREDEAAVIERFRHLHAATAMFVDDRVAGQLQLLPALASRPRQAPAFAGAPLVVMGGNAGAADALVEVLATLPRDLAAPVLAYVLHATWIAERLLDRLRRHSRLPVEMLATGTRLRAGIVYLAPARELAARLVQREYGTVAVIETADEARTTRALDGLLDTALTVAGRSTVAVVLSGAGPDGAAGAERVAAAGGVVLVQEPSTVAAAGAAEGLALRGIGSVSARPRDLGRAISAAVAEVAQRSLPAAAAS